jgi:superfamily II DNA/RNA helicase
MSEPTFADLGVSKPVVSALSERGIESPFPIQTATIEAALSGRDICGKAPTGSGKTLAFGIPAIDLSEKGSPWRPSALILSPTRELASQIKAELDPLAKAAGRSVLTVYGGTNIERDIKRLEQGIDILVACPGRLEDLMSRRCAELRNAKIVIVDEADRMADMGFLPSVKRILDQTPADRHTLLFSATLDGDVDTLIKRYQNEPLTYEIEEQIGDVGDVEHSWYLIQPANRIDSAVDILNRYQSSIVFCRTRRGCDRVARMLKKKGLGAVAIHGDRSQSQRERALADFTNGKAHVLVATDVAARGIHVDNVSLVMHYDPAGSDKDYIHRSGRTGRAGQDGRVISMVVEDKKKIARQLQKDLGMKPGLESLDISTFPPVAERPVYVEPEPQQKPSSDGQRRKNNRNRNDRGGRNEGRGRNDRNDRRDRKDRTNRRGRNEDRGRSDRNERGDGDRNDRDDRPSGRGKPRRHTRGRRGNDWYPPGYHDDDRDNRAPSNKRSGKKSPEKKSHGKKGPAKGAGARRNERWSDDDRRTGPSKRRGSGKGRPSDSRSGASRSGGNRSDNRSGSERSGSGRGGSGRGGSGRSGSWRDDETEERSPGGRNTQQRKKRSAKGRHADKNKKSTKGKRRK